MRVIHDTMIKHKESARSQKKTVDFAHGKPNDPTRKRRCKSSEQTTKPTKNSKQ